MIKAYAAERHAVPNIYRKIPPDFWQNASNQDYSPPYQCNPISNFMRPTPVKFSGNLLEQALGKYYEKID